MRHRLIWPALALAVLLAACSAGGRAYTTADAQALIDALVAQTGYEEIALLSLSSSDYRQIETLVRELATRHGDQRLSISLPSLRIDSVSVDLMEQLQRDFRIMVTGPTTLAAILNSLQMGFKTLAIQKSQIEH